MRHMSIKTHITQILIFESFKKILKSENLYYNIECLLSIYWFSFFILMTKYKRMI